MSLVLERTEACTSCGLCVATCPTGALRPAPLHPELQSDRCNLCLACIEVCPRNVFSEKDHVGYDPPH
ncbi:MAG: 4Fe-4S binding protein [Actinomycetota bacterium]|nr:4Fe-4S binding protein [Actinomycetota bacterium]